MDVNSATNPPLVIIFVVAIATEDFCVPLREDSDLRGDEFRFYWMFEVIVNFIVFTSATHKS